MLRMRGDDRIVVQLLAGPAITGAPVHQVPGRLMATKWVAKIGGLRVQ